ncbi:MAG TPA: GNAT family N-acetyltransferase [Gaiellaceae bacterium]|nr:GNAT family N-acetyltransferase [Gaiellaceae bacterium]
MTVTIRRARADDVDFIVDLASHDDVEPFLGAVSAKDRESVAAEVERSLAEPHDFGRFVIDVDGDRAGTMGFELANRRSRIAHLERLAVHPHFRGRRVADAAARLLQRHLVADLGYHRLQLEIYGFNERAMAHAERAAFVREGTRRRAYRRHGSWADGVMFGLVADELDVSAAVLILHDFVGDHNECVRTGDWSALGAWFTEDAELGFDGIPVGPFIGRDAIAAAYRERPPDDRVLTFSVEEANGDVIALYGWLATPAEVAGRMVVTTERDRIRRLRVTFEQGLSWS